MHVWYMCHPVRGDGSVAAAAANIARAKRWYTFLSEVWPDVALNANWMIEVEVRRHEQEQDAPARVLGLRRDAAVVRRMDAVVLVGGTISTGMRCEIEAAESAGIPIIDLTWLGSEPPP